MIEQLCQRYYPQQIDQPLSDRLRVFVSDIVLSICGTIFEYFRLVIFFTANLFV